MKIEWLMEEVEVPHVSYTEEDDESRARFSVGDVTYQVTFWPVLWKVENPNWSMQFYQQNDKGHLVFDNMDSLSFSEMVGLFLGLDRSMELFFEHRSHVMVLDVHPEAISDKRRGLVTKRSKKERTSYSVFDPGKFGAYQMAFKHSRLAQQGFRMVDEGEHLLIMRPGYVAGFEKEVNDLP